MHVRMYEKLKDPKIVCVRANHVDISFKICVFYKNVNDEKKRQKRAIALWETWICKSSTYQQFLVSFARTAKLKSSWAHTQKKHTLLLPALHTTIVLCRQIFCFDWSDKINWFFNFVWCLVCNGFMLSCPLIHVDSSSNNNNKIQPISRQMRTHTHSQFHLNWKVLKLVGSIFNDDGFLAVCRYINLTSDWITWWRFSMNVYGRRHLTFD